MTKPPTFVEELRAKYPMAGKVLFDRAAEVDALLDKVAELDRQLAGFFVEDVVCRNDNGIIGEVVGPTRDGFCPAAKWIRVKTRDGRIRIWLKDNIHRVTNSHL